MENPSIFQALGKQRIEQLDGLRAICALVVLMTHLINGAYWFTNNIDFSPSLFFKSIASFGHIAVLIFFVLSGFVIGYTTPQKFTWKEAKNYVIRRLIRLYPIYLFALLLTFIFTENTYNLLDIVGHLFFLQGWLVPVIKNNLALWSLHYEFIFYLLFLIIWNLNIKIDIAIVVCIISGIFSAIFRFHPFEILGYFTLWLSGLWLAQNIESLKLISKRFISYSFFSSCLLLGAFSSQNILKMAIDKYGTSSSVLPDILLTTLVTSIVAALIVERKLYWYNLSFFMIFLIEVITVAYAWQQHTFDSLEGLQFGYQSVGFFILLLPFTLLLRKIPINWFKKLTNIASFSYALYVIHHPLIIIVYRLLKLNDVHTMFLVWTINIVAAVLSLSLAWFLECYLHVKIAKKLKIQFQLN
ncbi:MAG: acyltransferase [Nostoc sp.]|uniref:acyltransferase family protein n=1 Tax=Nostoc sp. TaxID=1180 RepID=UPI002FF19383